MLSSNAKLDAKMMRPEPGHIGMIMTMFAQKDMLMPDMPMPDSGIICEIMLHEADVRIAGHAAVAAEKVAASCTKAELTNVKGGGFGMMNPSPGGCQAYLIGKGMTAGMTAEQSHAALQALLVPPITHDFGSELKTQISYRVDEDARVAAAAALAEVKAFCPEFFEKGPLEETTYPAHIDRIASHSFGSVDGSILAEASEDCQAYMKDKGITAAKPPTKANQTKAWTPTEKLVSRKCDTLDGCLSANGRGTSGTDDDKRNGMIGILSEAGECTVS
jgi:hypothetical protein